MGQQIKSMMSGDVRILFFYLIIFWDTFMTLELYQSQIIPAFFVAAKPQLYLYMRQSRRKIHFGTTPLVHRKITLVLCLWLFFKNYSTTNKNKRK